MGFALSGCSMMEPMVAEAPNLPGIYAQETTPGPRRDLGGWWRRFHDPVLERLVEQARRQNLSIAQASARLAAGRSQAEAAPSLFLPTVGGSGQAVTGTSREQIEDPLRRPLMAGFDTSWDAGLFGLAASTNKVAAASLAIVGDELDAVRITVTAEVAAAYISLRSIQRQRELTVALVAAQERRAQFARSRSRTGMAASGEEADSAASLDEARAELARLEARATAMRQQIAMLLGSSAPDAALFTPGSQPISRDTPMAGRPAELLRARPDVRAAEQRVLKAAAEIGIAKADLYPRLRLGGTIGIGGPSIASPFGIAGGPSIQIPLFDYGRRAAALHARRALLDEALAAYRQNVLTAYQEASVTLANWRAAREGALRLGATVEAEQRGERRIRVLRREGLAEATRLAESDASLLLTRRRLAVAKEMEALALVALYKALGAAAAVPEQREAGG
ncbi:efflux transporter outer membrane subunit [Bosea psychrotolerans]|uniref:NodT family efflux transporter outer membrane factor (OMF) lipoprotein n=1 Tax=Bosea psychrotolerans TaxID=1871628 RepID=A0A2S4LVR2_9HYPH|nr:efflux transporter outer membrane subunit [Bosea psychrotolerans]POR46528.1 NodT family efflux transporter outer membrane factor (OMF) lipoprotein [Bosea psychrotolerans]